MIAATFFIIASLVIVGFFAAAVKLFNRISADTQGKIVFWTLATLGSVVVALWAAVGITALFRAVI